MLKVVLVFFFFNDTATTEIYTLSLHDALPILPMMALKLENMRMVHISLELHFRPKAYGPLLRG